MIDVLILAGGFGTRLQPVVPDQPKCLADVAGRPFLSYQLNWLIKQDVASVTIAAHHLADQIIAYVDEQNLPFKRLHVIQESTPLGTGGAVANALRELTPSDPVLVINGDTYFTFNIEPFIHQHQRLQTPATIAVSPVDNVARFGTVIMEDSQVTHFEQARGIPSRGYVNSGAYVIDPALVEEMPKNAFSIEAGFFPSLAQRRALGAFILENDGAFVDIGTPESFSEFCKSQASD